jgi:glycosyltransferase involved in cell wall biosynthesis
MKILHVFYSTIPSSTGGDIRSRDIVETQVAAGIDLLAASSPFQPPVNERAEIEQIGGVTYYRCFREEDGLVVSEYDQGLGTKIKKTLRLRNFALFLSGLIDRERPDIVHAHSTFFCAFASYLAARKANVPLVYEVRSLWEERSRMFSPSLKTKLITAAIKFCETCAMRLSSHIVVISEGLRVEVRERGVPAHKISVIGNATNLMRIKQEHATLSMKDPTEWVFGYVGNLSDIEGLDDFIVAAAGLRAANWTNRIEFHGDGPAMVSLRKMAQGIAGVEFFGRFQPEDASKIYGRLDCIVNPRKKSALTDKVTPLKPLEAMAYRKPVIVSSVAGMLELVEDGRTGYVFEAGSTEDLVRVLQYTTANPAKLAKVADQAYDFVLTKRSWQSNAMKYKRLYEQLLAGRAKSRL